MRNLLVVLSLLLLFATPETVNAKHTAIPAATSVEKMLVGVTERNWQQWSRGDGSITFQELADCMANPAYKGEDAAVLAGLVQYMLDAKPNKQNWTKPEINNLLLHNERVQKDCLDNLCNFYQSNSALYTADAPRFFAVSQGKLGNCFLVSAIGWLALNHPDEIKAAIEPTAQGYNVHFPSGKVVKVDPPTEAEIVFNNRYAGGDGLWVTVLQKAFGEKYANYSSFQDNVETTLNTADGGLPFLVQHIWTGKTALGVAVKPETRALVREKLMDIKEKGYLAQTCTDDANAKGAPVPGIVYGHAYALLAFNPVTNHVTIWNPWGNNFVPNGKEGLQNGYLTRGGIFTMAFDDYLQVFGELMYEGEEAIVTPFLEVG